MANPGDMTLLIFGGVWAVGAVSVASTAAGCFRRCGPDQALIVSGMFTSANPETLRGSNRMFFRSGMLIVTAGGYMVLPMIQQCAYLSLAPIEMRIKPQTALLTSDEVPLDLDARAQVRVPKDPDRIALAAQSLLNKTADEVRQIAEGLLIGELRAIVGTMTALQVVQGVGKVTENVRAKFAESAKDFGLELTSLSILEFKDNSGYFEAVRQRKLAEPIEPSY